MKKWKLEIHGQSQASNIQNRSCSQMPKTKSGTNPDLHAGKAMNLTVWKI